MTWCGHGQAVFFKVSFAYKSAALSALVASSLYFVHSRYKCMPFVQVSYSVCTFPVSISMGTSTL